MIHWITTTEVTPMIQLRSMIFSTTATLVMVFCLLQPANAGMIGTKNLLKGSPSLQDITTLRQEIKNQMVELGVDRQQVEVRVASMTDAQIMEVDKRISEMAAGASAGGVILTIFIIFVITDVIGATDIFPFIHPVK